MNTRSDRTEDSRQPDRIVVEYKMMKIRQREGGGRGKVVEEVLRLCTYIRGERGWGEINESGLAMQAFAGIPPAKSLWRDRGLGRYMAWTAWTAQQAQEPPGGTVCGRVQRCSGAAVQAAAEVAASSYLGRSQQMRQ